MDDIQATVFMAGQTLNDVTGYSAIEKIKKSIQEQEKRLIETRERVQKCKETYSEAIARRSNSQREVNELLQRKHMWSPEDLQRFTDLYRSDHTNELAEQEAEKHLGDAELQFEEQRQEITKLISARYHEEQIWSDKIRRASTYGTWGLMVFNIVLFMVVQLGLEPWKRRRLVGSFEDKVKSAIDTAKQDEIQQTTEFFETHMSNYQHHNEEPSSVVKAPTPSLEWRSFASRVGASIEDGSLAIATRPVELATTVGIATLLGAAIGSLITLAFK
ncbi:hypothetical protein TRVA0_034S01024 [Trichomonascus vanleenenianus]|uniref:She9p n=1 Tax=Trichomonascus vanleenenianus TaxID=2268995 RepID=UPI003EC9A8E4